MKKEMTYIEPVRAGLVVGVILVVVSLVFVPIFLLVAVLGAAHGPAGAVFPLIFVIFMPVLYGVAGFLEGLIGAAIYNLVVKFTGGFQVEVRDVMAAM